jgi:pimeloyl-ACP methyl ester carboxylesterase
MSNIVILHGWGSNSLRWQRVRELLEEKGIETLILDLPGFGVTPSPSSPWIRDDYIKWVFQKIKEKNWHKFYLLGHSFGGGLSLKIAANFPEKIEKLILCAPAIIRRKRLKTYLFYWLAFFGKKIFSLPGLRSLRPYAQRLVYKLAGVRDYYVADGVMKETMKQLHQEELEGFLEKIKIPVLVVWGEKDDVLPVKDAHEIKEKIRNSELKIIPKAKHSPHREVPDQLAEIIINFLQ